MRILINILVLLVASSCLGQVEPISFPPKKNDNILIWKYLNIDDGKVHYTEDSLIPKIGYTIRECPVCGHCQPKITDMKTQKRFKSARQGSAYWEVGELWPPQPLGDCKLACQNTGMKVDAYLPPDSVIIWYKENLIPEIDFDSINTLSYIVMYYKDSLTFRLNNIVQLLHKSPIEIIYGGYLSIHGLQRCIYMRFNNAKYWIILEN